ncbi:DUF6090 family protein [Aegicerativicinus sediminis]|uniref:DUF6090 family protein n=1 Tax=Aegicerativicinus sediminis TaxID=2893202 RepID=UPI001E620DD5|nr:DUF6090 family protein [Aegicerativicinus sediminis]
MIKFFRGIRQQLVMENKTSKYLKYAIGEILLVVIGILIALQINNWNEDRKLRNTEHYYLKELKSEFKKNLKEINKVMARNNANLENALLLANYLASDSITLSNYDFDKHLFKSIVTEIQYRPSPGTLNEILNSGKLEIISNKTLRTKLSSWEAVLLKVRFQELEHATPRLKLLDLTYAQGNFREGYAATTNKTLDLKPRSSSIHNKKVFRTDQEFDNLMSVFYLSGQALNNNYYEELKEKIEGILELVDSELKIYD